MSLTTQRALRSLLAAADEAALRTIFADARQVSTSRSRPILRGRSADRPMRSSPRARKTDWPRSCGFACGARCPWWIIGGGSNVLVGDGGVRGIVIRLAGDFAAVRVAVEDGRVIVEAGGSAGMALVTAKAASAGAEGIGSLAGIPGTIGGSLRMNAGTDREIGDFVASVWVQSPSRPDPHCVSVRYLYRHSTLERDVVVSRVTLAFAARELERSARRDARPSRPSQADAADCDAQCGIVLPEPGRRARRHGSSNRPGAKGWREGGAEVSALHANFINNAGGATARDVATLLARVRRAVLDRSGVELQLGSASRWSLYRCNVTEGRGRRSRS